MPDNPTPVDDDPEYAGDAADDATDTETFGAPTDPADVPPDQGDSGAVKEAGQ